MSFRSVRFRGRASSRGGRVSPLTATVLGVLVLLAAFSFLANLRQRHPDEWLQAYSFEGESFCTLCYSPDGTYLAAGSGTGDVVVWNLKTGQSKKQPRLLEESVVALGVSPDGFLMASDTAGHCAGWQLGTGRTQTIPRLPVPVTCMDFYLRFGVPEMVLGLADGQLVFFSPSGAVRVRGPQRGGVRCVRYTPDGKFLVTGGADGTLTWWSALAHAVVGTARPHSAEVADIEFAGRGQLMATADWNGQVLVWDARSRKIKAEVQEPSGVAALAWSPTTPPSLITASWDGRLRFYSLNLEVDRKPIRTRRPFYDLVIAPRPKTFATVSGGSSVDVWRLPGLQKTTARSDAGPAGSSKE